MFVKIEIDSQEVATYKMSKTDINIGSSPALAHIIITDKTISKKHARIVQEDGAWYVVDQGSTNGTFFDGQQLVPGKKIKIDVDDIIGLGSKVTMTLVSEADNAQELSDPSQVKATAAPTSAQASISSEADRTRVISLDDLKNAKAQADQKRAVEQKAKRVADQKRKKAETDRMFKIAIICAAVVGGGIYFNDQFKEKIKHKPRETIAKKIQQKAKADEEILTDVEGFRISRATLFPRNRIASMFKDTKCVTDEAKVFCSSEEFPTNDNGVIFLKPATYIIYLEENEQMDMVKKKLPLDAVLGYDTLHKLSFFNFFKERLAGKTIDPKTAFYFSFYRYNDKKEPDLNYVYAVSGGSVPLLMSELETLNFSAKDAEINALIEKVEQYFTTY